jgi:hypothetical protein
LREAVLALVDDDADRETRLARGAAYYTPRGLDAAGVLSTLLSKGGEALRCLSAYHAGELGLDSLGPELEQLAHGGSPFEHEVATRALALLRHPETEVVQSVRSA